MSFTGTPCRGLLASPNYLHLVFKNLLYQVDKQGNQIGSLSGVIESESGLVSMSQNGQQIIIVDGKRGYVTDYYDSTFSALSLITSAGFPNGAQTVAFLSGFFICERPNTGQFCVSDAYDGATWDELMFATIEQSPDYCVAVDVNNGILIPFGREHMEFWEPSGALDFPFRPVASAAQPYGLAAIFSRAHVGNSLIFLSTNRQGEVQVRKLQGYVPERVSNTDLEYIINRFSTVDDATALSYTVDGHDFYQITFPTANQSFLYDATSDIWSDAQTGVELVNRHAGNLSTLFDGRIVVTDFANDNLYTLDPTAYTDNGVTIKRQIQSRHVIDDGNVLGVDELFLDMETGVGLQSGQGSDPQIMLQISKDGGRTFGSERWVPLGAVGQYKGPRAIWRRIGSARDFVARWTMTDPVKFTINYGAAKVREKPQ